MAEVADAAEQGSTRDEEVTSNELASYELPSSELRVRRRTKSYPRYPIQLSRVVPLINRPR